MIFDLDDTLVHSDAVRTTFTRVAAAHDIPASTLTETLDALPGRPAREIFEALGLEETTALEATERFLATLDEHNATTPPEPYPDATATLHQLQQTGATLVLSTGSSRERAENVLESQGWRAGFSVILGSDAHSLKGAEHYVSMQRATGEQWTERAVTVGDSPQDMRLGAEHGIPVRIGVDRRRNPSALKAAGATHVVRTLAEIIPIVTRATAPALG